MQQHWLQALCRVCTTRAVLLAQRAAPKRSASCPERRRTAPASTGQAGAEAEPRTGPMGTPALADTDILLLPASHSGPVPGHALRAWTPTQRLRTAGLYTPHPRHKRTPPQLTRPARAGGRLAESSLARQLDGAVLPANKVRKPTRSMPCHRARTEPVPGGALLRARLPASLTARCWLVNSAAATSGMSDTEGIAPLERAPLPRSAHLMRRCCCAGSAQLARVVTPRPRRAFGSC